MLLPYQQEVSTSKERNWTPFHPESGHHSTWNLDTIPPGIWTPFHPESGHNSTRDLDTIPPEIWTPFHLRSGHHSTICRLQISLPHCHQGCMNPESVFSGVLIWPSVGIPKTFVLALVAGDKGACWVVWGSHFLGEGGPTNLGRS